MRATISKFLNQFIHEEEAQGVSEYLLIISTIMFGAVQLARAILGALDKGVLRLGGQLEKDLRTGRTPLNVWKN